MQELRSHSSLKREPGIMLAAPQIDIVPKRSLLCCVKVQQYMAPEVLCFPLRGTCGNAVESFVCQTRWRFVSRMRFPIRNFSLPAADLRRCPPTQRAQPLRVTTVVTFPITPIVVAHYHHFHSRDEELALRCPFLRRTTQAASKKRTTRYCCVRLRLKTVQSTSHPFATSTPTHFPTRLSSSI